MNKSNRVLVVEDDAAIVRALSSFLTDEGFLCKSANGQAEALRLFEQEEFDIVLLDVSLADGSGFVVCSAMKSKKDIPIIFLTASGDEHSVVTGLELGADDYIAKPFGMLELISRIRAVLRRTGPETEEKSWRIGSLYVQPGRHIVQAGGMDVALTYKEYELLCALLEADGRVLTRDTLLSTIWGYDFDGETRTVDVHVRTLRQKLGECGELIETVRGVGYRLRETAV